MKQQPKVIIVGTIPYNNQTSSRALDAYFHYWERNRVSQVFSNAKTPCKGHCDLLYQITDERLVQCHRNQIKEPGLIFDRNNLPDKWEDANLEIRPTYKRFYRFGAAHSPITHLLRKLLWRKKYWCTAQFNSFLDAFHPDCVFVCSSDDFFIYEIALYVAERFNIPIVTAISDDYCFNNSLSLNPFYYLYKKTYMRLVRKVYKKGAYGVFISDKIRDKYKCEFGMRGQTVYLTSTVKRASFKPINKEAPLITYFGNIRMGRNSSLNEIAIALRSINQSYQIEVYSNEADPMYYEILVNNPNIRYGGSIAYEDVQRKMESSDITIIVEGFKKEDIDWSRYSLSTKAADSLASGASILTYGSQECGIIEYMQSTDASMVCTNKKDLTRCINELMNNVNLQKHYYDRQIVVSELNHNLETSTSIVENVINNALHGEQNSVY